MTSYLNIPLLIASLFFANAHLKAQEQLVPLHANNSLISPSTGKPPVSARTASLPALTLPFFEDFSYAPLSPYPRADYWLDSNVFINHTFPVAPPSIGVATFDGLNKNGYPYNLYASPTSSGPADKLTSRPINLLKNGPAYYAVSDSIYLSFYYQARGRGSDPSPADSLSLDFYKPRQKKWQTVWRAKGYSPATADSLFHLVMLPIKDTACFDSLFQFRFRSRATLSGSLDHWHVDYIRIDKNRSYAEAAIEDDAFQYMSTPYLKNYSTMPYRQYQPSEMATSLNNYIRNNDVNTRNTSYQYTVFDNSGLPVNTYNGGNANVLPYITNGLHQVPQHATPAIPFAFPSPMSGINVFTIKHVISTNPDACRQNDTMWQTQRFTDYFAYDDGTAEQAYTLLSTTGSKYAIRYTLNVADTIRALRIYFDPTKDGPSILNSGFDIMVWNSGPGGPGSLLYSDNNVNHHPVYLQGKYNLMPVYFLSSCLILQPGTYYFGIRQNTNTGLNIGFDKNTNHSDALFFDTGSGWTQSSLRGSLMINPVMGCHQELLPVGVEEHRASSGMTLFPNPTQNNIVITTDDASSEPMLLSIVSAVGQTIYSSTYTPGETLNVSHLPNGIYFIYLSGGKSITNPQKLLIAR